MYGLGFSLDPHPIPAKKKSVCYLVLLADGNCCCFGTHRLCAVWCIVWRIVWLIVWRSGPPLFGRFTYCSVYHQRATAASSNSHTATSVTLLVSLVWRAVRSAGVVALYL